MVTLLHCTCYADPAGLDEPLLGACDDEGEVQHGDQRYEPCRSGRKAGSAMVPYSINAYDWPDLLRSLAAGAANGLRNLKGAVAHVMPHKGAFLPACLPCLIWFFIRCERREFTGSRKAVTRHGWPCRKLGSVGHALSSCPANSNNCAQAITPGNCKAQVPTAVPGMAFHWSRCLSRHVCALMPWLLLLQRRWRGACRGGGPAPTPGCQWGSWHSCSACGIASLCPTILTSRSTRFFLGHHCI